MLATQIESGTTSKRHYDIASDAAAGEAPIPPTVVLQQEVTESLTAWLEEQECQAIAEKFYRIGQVSLRQGIPLQKLFKVIHRWTEQVLMSQSLKRPCMKAFTSNGKSRETQDAAEEFMAFVRHYLIRGYQDAIR